MFHTRLTRFALLALLTIGALAMPAAAQEEPAVNEDLSGDVSFWTAYNTVSGEFSTLTDTIIPAFNEQYPNVTVDAQALPYDELRQRLLTGIAGGQTPDLLRADIIWVAEFAELGALARLDETMPDFQTYADQVYPATLETNVWNGGYYGLPLDTNTRTLFYNETLFGEAGIEAPPATFEEFMAACEQVMALDQADSSCFAEGGTGAWNVLPWIWSAGGAITDPEYTTATGYLNGPETVAAVTMLRDMLESGAMSESILGGGIATSDAIGNAQTGMIVDGPWMPPIFAAQYPELEYGLATFPAGSGGSVSVVGGENIVLFEASENEEAALAFLRFMLTEEAQLALGQVGQMPVLTSLAGHPELPDYYPVFQEQLETAMPRTPSPAWPMIDEAISTAVQLVLRGEQEPQAALDEAAATVDSLLAQYQD